MPGNRQESAFCTKNIAENAEKGQHFYLFAQFADKIRTIYCIPGTDGTTIAKPYFPDIR